MEFVEFIFQTFFYFFFQSKPDRLFYICFSPRRGNKDLCLDLVDQTIYWMWLKYVFYE